MMRKKDEEVKALHSFGNIGKYIHNPHARSCTTRQHSDLTRSHPIYLFSQSRHLKQITATILYLDLGIAQELFDGI